LHAACNLDILVCERLADSFGTRGTKVNAVPRTPPSWRVGHNPKIFSGEPIVEGTRIPVSSIVVQWLYYRNLERVLSAFPSLDRHAVDCALDYYDKHQKEIDHLIEESEKAANAAK